MTDMNFAERKIQAAHKLLDVDNVTVLEKIEQLLYVVPLVNNCPCCYSEDDIEQRLKVTSQRAIRGEGITMDELDKHLERWAL